MLLSRDWRSRLRPKFNPLVYRALRDTYPSKSLRDIAAWLGVSESAVRRGLQKAPASSPPSASELLIQAGLELSRAGL